MMVGGDGLNGYVCSTKTRLRVVQGLDTTISAVPGHTNPHPTARYRHGQSISARLICTWKDTLSSWLMELLKTLRFALLHGCHLAVANGLHHPQPEKGWGTDMRPPGRLIHRYIGTGHLEIDTCHFLARCSILLG